MNNGKGAIAHYYQQVNDTGYGIGFDLVLDGIYQTDKIEGPKEFVPGIGNLKFTEPEKIDTDKEKDFVRCPGKKIVCCNEEFLDGEKMDNEIIYGEWKLKNRLDTTDIDEAYIDNFFRNGGCSKKKTKVQLGYKRKNQYHHSTSQAGKSSGIVFQSKGSKLMDLTKYIPEDSDDQGCSTRSKQFNNFMKVPRQGNIYQKGLVRQTGVT